ncbi:MAG: hypothetical protein AB1330_01680 [Bacillota bacterium]
MVLVTHDDLDGVACAVLFKKLFPDGVVYCESYDTVNDRVKQLVAEQSPEVRVYIADISVNPEIAELLDKRGNVVLFDHHETAMWLNRYDWVRVSLDRCGAWMLYDRLRTVKRTLFWDSYRDFIERVDDYDRWVHRFPESRLLNRLLGILGRERFIARFLANPSLVFTEFEEYLLEVEEDRVRRYCEEQYVHLSCDAGGRPYGVCFAENYISELAHYLMEKHGLEYVVVLGLRGTSRSPYGKAYLRGRMCDVSAMAKRRGGGGRAATAGYALSPDAVREVIHKLWEEA